MNTGLYTSSNMQFSHKYESFKAYYFNMIVFMCHLEMTKWFYNV